MSWAHLGLIATCMGCNLLYPYDGEFVVEDCETDRVDHGPCGALPTFADGIKPASLIFAAPDGTPTAAGTRAEPFDLSTALDNLAPGVALRLLGGTYAGQSIASSDLRGTADAPIWIGGCPGDKPVLDGTALSPITIKQPQYLVIHDIEITGPVDARSAVELGDGGVRDMEVATNVVLRGLDIHDLDDDASPDSQPNCIRLTGVYDFWVTDNKLQRCAIKDLTDTIFSKAIDLVGSHRGVVARNAISDIPYAGISLGGGTSDVDIARNVIKAVGVRGIALGQFVRVEDFRPPLPASTAHASDVRVYANVIEGAREAALGYEGARNCRMEHNTFVFPDKEVFRFSALDDIPSLSTVGGDADFVNNIVVAGEEIDGALRNDFDVAAAMSVRFDRTFWQVPADKLNLVNVVDVAGIYGLVAQLDMDDFTLGAGSDAIAAGTPTSITGDLFGGCYANPPSVGAHEPQ